MKKIFLVFLTYILVFSSFSVFAYADDFNPFVGITAGKFDNSSVKTTVQANGAVDINGAGWLLYKDVSFYKPADSVEITYATGTFVNPRQIKLTLDSPENEPIAEITLEETTLVSNYRSKIFELKSKVSGIHDVYLTDVNGSAARIKTVKFIGALESNVSANGDFPLLKALGIINSEFLSEDVKRGIFADCVSKLFKRQGAYSDISFNDVNKTESYYGAVCTMYQTLAMTAENGNFRPEDSVTADEAARAILVTAGYEPKVTAKYTGENMWFSAGMSEGLFSGCDISKNSVLSAYDCAKIFENALKLAVPKASYPDMNVSYGDTNGTVLNVIHEVYEDTGIVFADETTALYSPDSAVGGGKVLIGARTLNITSPEIRSFLGYKVRYYYKTKNKENTLVAFSQENYNKVKTIDASDIKDFSDNTLLYEENGRQKRIHISNTADVLYNGVSRSDYINDDFKFTEGEVIFIDSDSDSTYETVKINHGKVYIADTVDIPNKTVYFKNDGTSAQSVSADAPEVCEVYLNGTLTDIGEISEGDVVTVYDSYPVSGRVRKRILKVSDKTARTSLKEITDKYYITNEDKKLFALDGALGTAELNVLYKLHLSERDKIAYFEKASDRSFKYGLLMSMKAKSGAFSQTLRLKMLTEESEVKVFETTDGILCDGTKFSDPNALYTFILNGDEKLRPQVVRYTLDKDGRVKEIDTAYMGTGETKEDNLVKNLRYNTADYRSNTGYFWRTSPIDDDTVVFITPLYYTTAAEDIDSADDADFFTLKARHFAGISTYSEGYDGTFCKPMGAIISYKMNRNEFSETSPVIYITEVSEALDRKGNITKRITGITKGEVKTLTLNSNVMDTKGHLVKSGDLWLYNLDLKNEVTYFEPLWSTDGTDYDGVYKLHSQILSKSNLNICYAEEITDRYNNYIEAKVLGTQCGFSLETANIMIYDKQKQTVNAVSASGVPTNAQASSDGRNQYAFIYAYTQEVQYVIIVWE